DALTALLKHHPDKDGQELQILRLGIRAFNAAAAAMKLGRAGYYQPASAMVRDIVEVQFLVDLFRRDQSRLEAWIKLEPREREKAFRPVKVRELLDDMDGFTKRKRADAYKLLSNYAAHVSPEGFKIIPPGGLTQIGPYPSKEILT